eukprot:6672440-Alexandrium_andersonii.AAC.1
MKRPAAEIVDTNPEPEPDDGVAGMRDRLKSRKFKEIFDTLPEPVQEFHHASLFVADMKFVCCHVVVCIHGAADISSHIRMQTHNNSEVSAYIK